MILKEFLFNDFIFGIYTYEQTEISYEIVSSCTPLFTTSQFEIKNRS